MKENRNCAVLSDTCHSRTRFSTLLIIGLILFCANVSLAQNRPTSVGLRLAYGGLLTYKAELSKSMYTEGILSIRWDGLAVAGLLGKQKHAFKNQNLYWNYAAGLTFGLHGRDNVVHPSDDANENIYINVGINLMAGIGYSMKNWPIDFTVDYMPIIYLTGVRDIVGEGFGFGLRYRVLQ